MNDNITVGETCRDDSQEHSSELQHGSEAPSAEPTIIPSERPMEEGREKESAKGQAADGAEKKYEDLMISGFLDNFIEAIPDDEKAKDYVFLGYSVNHEPIACRSEVEHIGDFLMWLDSDTQPHISQSAKGDNEDDEIEFRAWRTGRHWIVVFRSWLQACVPVQFDAFFVCRNVKNAKRSISRDYIDRWESPLFPPNLREQLRKQLGKRQG